MRRDGLGPCRPGARKRKKKGGKKSRREVGDLAAAKPAASSTSKLARARGEGSRPRKKGKGGGKGGEEDPQAPFLYFLSLCQMHRSRREEGKRKERRKAGFRFPSVEHGKGEARGKRERAIRTTPLTFLLEIPLERGGKGGKEGEGQGATFLIFLILDFCYCQVKKK